MVRASGSDREDEATARLRYAVEAAQVGTWDFQPKTGELIWDARCKELFGLPPDAPVTYETFLAGCHPDDRARIDAAVVASIAPDGPGRIDDEYRTIGFSDQVERWLATRGRAIFEDGVCTRFVGIVIDITARKRAEEALRAGEERLRLALAAGSLGDWSWDAATDMVTFSERAAAIFGIPPGPHMTWTEMSKLIDPAHGPRVTAAVDAALAGKDGYGVDYLIHRPDGRSAWVHAMGRAIQHADGTTKGMIGTVQDVTERRETEERLREQTRTLETLNRIGAALSAELELERIVQLVTDAGTELTGARFGAFFYNVINANGEAYTLYTLSGVDRSAFANFPMPRATAVFKPTFGGTGVVRSDDITADPRYGQSAPHYGMPKGHLPVRSYLALPVVSRSGEVLGGLFFGHPEPGRFTAGHESLMVGVTAQAAVAVDNARLYSELRDLNTTLEARVAANIAQREETEAALRQSQKMEAVGQLTGGVAHDFNNILQIVVGNLEMLQRNLPEEAARLRRAADNAMVGARRAATLTQRLLAFSRRQSLQPQPIDADRMVSSMAELLARTLGETIEMETVRGANLWRIEADPNQLENAILNLAVNARDAMPEGGRLTIETSNADLTQSYVAENRDAQPGQYVMIAISDSGTGMDKDTLARAFEPFFTTKEIGRGTGLGLSMVYGFVKQSGGHVKIYSEPGQGTTVKLYLPRQLKDLPEQTQADVAPAPEGSHVETILAVEDDAEVRAFSVEALRDLGYHVLEAQDGPSALRVLQNPNVAVDLLFSDIVLPGGLNGAQLAREARALHPGLKVLFTTGYARDAIVHHGRLDPGVELLGKPFAYGELAARVREILDGPARI